MEPRRTDRGKKSPAVGIIAAIVIFNLLLDLGGAAAFALLIPLGVIAFVIYGIHAETKKSSSDDSSAFQTMFPRREDARPAMSTRVKEKRTPVVRMNAPVPGAKPAPAAADEFRRHEEALKDLLRAGVIDREEASDRLARLREELARGGRNL